MNSKRPVLSSVLLIGLLFSAIFVSFFLVSFINNSRLLLAVAETITAVISSMALFFGVIYFMMRKRYQPDENIESVLFNRPDSIAKMPTKGTKPIVVAMTRTR